MCGGDNRRYPANLSKLTETLNLVSWSVVVWVDRPGITSPDRWNPAIKRTAIHLYWMLYGNLDTKVGKLTIFPKILISSR